MTPTFKVTMWLLLPIVAVVMLLSACSFGPTVMVSKGEAGGFREIINGQAEYCKLTTTEGVEVSEEAQAAFIEYCRDGE